MVTIYTNSAAFYKGILSEYFSILKDGERNRLEQIIGCIQNQSDISPAHISFEKELIKTIRHNNPDLFDNLENGEDFLLRRTLGFILKKYNRTIEESLNIKSEFSAIREIASKKGAKYYSVFDEIGKNLEQGKLPSIKQLFSASNYVQMINSED